MKIERDFESEHFWKKLIVRCDTNLRVARGQSYKRSQLRPIVGLQHLSGFAPGNPEVSVVSQFFVEKYIFKICVYFDLFSVELVKGSSLEQAPA